MARESPEFIWGQNTGLAPGEGRRAQLGLLSPGMSPARPLEQRRYLPAWLALGAWHSSGSLVPGVAPEPRGTWQPLSPLGALQGTGMGTLLTPSPAGPEQPPLEGLQLHRALQIPWSLFHIKHPWSLSCSKPPWSLFHSKFPGVYPTATPPEVYPTANLPGVYPAVNPPGVYSTVNPPGVYPTA